MRCSRFRKILRAGFEVGDQEHPEYADVQRHEHECRDCADFVLRRNMKVRGISVAGQPCIHIAYRVNAICKEHPDPWDCPDVVLVYSPTFREWGIPVRNQPRFRADCQITVSHCPWCGVELPRSLRTEYFERMDELGVDDALCSNRGVPVPYRSDAWWRSDPARYGTMRRRADRPKRRAPSR